MASEKKKIVERKGKQREPCILLSVKIYKMFVLFREVISTPYIVFTKAKLVIG